MARVYYYVTQNSMGGWDVKVEPHDKVNFRTKELAVAAATHHAKEHWDKNKVPTGVRIQLADGKWQEERTYGNDPFPPRG